MATRSSSVRHSRFSPPTQSDRRVSRSSTAITVQRNATQRNATQRRPLFGNQFDDMPRLQTAFTVRVPRRVRPLTLLVTLVAAAAAVTVMAPGAASQSYQSNQYPAGLHPSLCPHYPYCDNAVLGGFARGVAAIRHGDAHAAPGYPASLSPHACPNYPFCSHQIPPEAIHYRRESSAGAHYAFRRSAPPHQHQRQYPSGVDPATCPDYPYCH